MSIRKHYDEALAELNQALTEMGPTEQVFSTPVDKRTEDYISGRFG